MLLILIASLVGILLGLYVDFYLCIVLSFLPIVIYFIFQFLFRSDNSINIVTEHFARYKINIKNLFIFFICVLFFFIYTKNQLNLYDTKYKVGEINDSFKIISRADEEKNYNKYVCKNSSGDKFLVYFSSNTFFKKGDVVEVFGTFVLPDLARNTGGFNYRRYLNSQKIFGSIFVKDYYLSDVGKFNLIYFIQDEIYNSFKKLFPSNEMGLVIGMMIGETKDISDDVLESFKDTGITHLIAVSGSNVMYVLTCVQFLFNKICGKRKTYFISIFFIIIFMFVSGASSSVVRATIMATLVICADIFYQKSDTINNISISAFVLMIVSPLIIYDVGFVLSFGGTLGIVLLSKDFEKMFKRIKNFPSFLVETLAVTCSAQLILLPIMAFYFNTFSVLSIITNIIVVPISGFITILGFAVFVVSKIYFPLAKLLSFSLYFLTRFTIVVSQIFSKIPFSTVKVITPNVFEILFFYLSIIYVVRIQNKKETTCRFIKNKDESKNISLVTNFLKYKNVLYMVSIFLIIEVLYYNFPKNYIDVSVIDVGQGDAIFVKTNYNKNVLIDGGGSKTYDVGEKILVPYLLDRRVTYIDSIFSSHSDADHLNGILTAVKEFKVGKVYIAKNSLGYEELFEIASKRGTKIIELMLGDEVKIDDLIFKVIGPAKGVENKDVNAYSLIVKMQYKNKSMLFTGDINQEAELKLQNVKSDVLKVGHHGSNTSSALKFISKVKPEISVISVGKDNKYGHPSKEVVERLKKYSKVYTTSELGEIKLKIYKDIVKVE